MNGCNAMLKWEKSRKSRKSTKVAYGSHTDICKINESSTRSYKGQQVSADWSRYWKQETFLEVPTGTKTGRFWDLGTEI